MAESTYFRKIPVVIEARRLGFDYDVDCATAAWCGGRPIDTDDAILAIDTLEGTMTADVGDWIIKGVAGEFYPCKPEIFDATYEHVFGPLGPLGYAYPSLNADQVSLGTASIPTQPTKANREGDSQSMPSIYETDEPDIQEQVIRDVQARREVGIQRYGTALYPHNGRDALLDAYEEALDLTMYLKQALVER